MKRYRVVWSLVVLAEDENSALEIAESYFGDAEPSTQAIPDDDRSEIPINAPEGGGPSDAATATGMYDRDDG